MKNIKPSELIRLAIHDLEVVEAQSDKYVIDMNQWHAYSIVNGTGASRCFTCLAGSVMAVSLHAPPNQTTCPSNFEQSDLLLALDRFRLGQVGRGLETMGINQVVENYWPVPAYEYGSDKFKQRMLGMADYLEMKGL